MAVSFPDEAGPGDIAAYLFNCPCGILREGPMSYQSYCCDAGPAATWCSLIAAIIFAIPVLITIGYAAQRRYALEKRPSCVVLSDGPAKVDPEDSDEDASWGIAGTVLALPEKEGGTAVVGRGTLCRDVACASYGDVEDALEDAEGHGVARRWDVVRPCYVNGGTLGTESVDITALMPALGLGTGANATEGFLAALAAAGVGDAGDGARIVEGTVYLGRGYGSIEAWIIAASVLIGVFAVAVIVAHVIQCTSAIQAKLAYHRSALNSEEDSQVLQGFRCGVLESGLPHGGPIGAFAHQFPAHAEASLVPPQDAPAGPEARSARADMRALRRVAEDIRAGRHTPLWAYDALSATAARAAAAAQRNAAGSAARAMAWTRKCHALAMRAEVAVRFAADVRWGHSGVDPSRDLDDAAEALDAVGGGDQEYADQMRCVALRIIVLRSEYREWVRIGKMSRAVLTEDLRKLADEYSDVDFDPRDFSASRGERPHRSRTEARVSSAKSSRVPAWDSAAGGAGPHERHGGDSSDRAVSVGPLAAPGVDLESGKGTTVSIVDVGDHGHTLVENMDPPVEYESPDNARPPPSIPPSSIPGLPAI